VWHAVRTIASAATSAVVRTMTRRSVAIPAKPDVDGPAVRSRA
jgi:hypothetical protein